MEKVQGEWETAMQLMDAKTIHHIPELYLQEAVRYLLMVNRPGE
nr:MAG TPA: hypothetical protein [Caudoviricetes sp.]